MKAEDAKRLADANMLFGPPVDPRVVPPARTRLRTVAELEAAGRLGRATRGAVRKAE